MSRSCTDRSGSPLPPPEGELLIALAGNPNVGKSTIFNVLTGVGVSTANYPGTTREVHTASTTVGDRVFGVIDLPGAYGLGGPGDDERAVRRALLEVVPDVVVAVVDASALARNLFLVLELLDLGQRTVIALNLTDEAERKGLQVDSGVLSAALGVTVVPTVATRGTGIEALVRAAAAAAEGARPTAPLYSAELEALLEPLIEACERIPEPPCGYSPRTLAVELYQGRDLDIGDSPAASEARDAAERARDASRALWGESPGVRMARERHGAAGILAAEAIVRTEPRLSRLPHDLWSLTTWPWTGIPLVALVAASIFGFLFFVGDALAGLFASAWGQWASPAIARLIASVAGEGTTAEVLRWGFDAGIEASLSIGLPYILTFYFLLGLLEDSGYLNSLAFLTDRAMHRLGLHGRSIIPLVAAAGCSVPALIATRDLPTRRERLVVGTLALFVPCSARTAVILGAVGHYIGWQPAALTFAILFAVWLALGITLDRALPGTSGGLVMEMFGFRRPSIRGVARRAWLRFREFLFVATPIVIVGSLVLGWLYETDTLFALTAPLEPFIEGWLGLPAIAGLTLVVGTLRKELSLQLLIALAVATAGIAGEDLLALMTPTDLVVYALVNAIALPCISAVAVFGKYHGIARTAMVLGVTVIIALVVGGAVARILPALGWT